MSRILASAKGVVQGRLAVRGDVDRVAQARLAEGVQCQPRIHPVVLDEEDVGMPVHCAPPGNRTENALPSPTFDSTHTWPPINSADFLTMANPTPVPGSASTLCRRWKMLNILSWNSGAIPMPVSTTRMR